MSLQKQIDFSIRKKLFSSIVIIDIFVLGDVEKTHKNLRK